MANRYGEAALKAVRQGRGDPALRWENAMNELYPTSPMARERPAPRAAFLGLCEAGLVKGISPGTYTAAKDNKTYAVQAAGLLADKSKTWSVTTLWQTVTGDPDKKHNSQMDVVLALWKNGLLLEKS